MSTGTRKVDFIFWESGEIFNRASEVSTGLGVWGAVIPPKVHCKKGPGGEEVDAGDGFGKQCNEDFPAKAPNQNECGHRHSVHQQPGRWDRDLHRVSCNGNNDSEG